MRSARETLRPFAVVRFGTKAGDEALSEMANETLPATAFKSPAIALSGVVDYEMYTKFRTQFDNASDQNIVVIELSTLGGDPEVARMMGETARFSSRLKARPLNTSPGSSLRSNAAGLYCTKAGPI
jgi:hypothetical protein